MRWIPAIQQGDHRPRPVRHRGAVGNRNFDGRIHPYAKQAFLASPPLVVAYAIAGTVRFDIEKRCAGVWMPMAKDHA